MSDSVSFTAHLKIEKVNKKQNADRGSASHGAVSRDVVETLNLTIKASTFTRLQEKIAAHVSILEEDDV